MASLRAASSEQAKGWLEDLELDSGHTKKLLKIFSDSYLDKTYKREKWKLGAASHIVNPDLILQYQERLHEMKQSIMNQDDLTEKHCFTVAGKKNEYVDKIVKFGLGAQRTPYNAFGDSAKGLYVSKHCDIMLKYAEDHKDTKSLWIIIHKVVFGRKLPVHESINKDPTPGHDCHVSAIVPDVNFRKDTQVMYSQVYIYEFDAKNKPVKRPRQCLPIALVKFERVKEEAAPPQELAAISSFPPPSVSQASATPNVPIAVERENRHISALQPTASTATVRAPGPLESKQKSATAQSKKTSQQHQPSPQNHNKFQQLQAQKTKQSPVPQLQQGFQRQQQQQQHQPSPQHQNHQRQQPQKSIQPPQSHQQHAVGQQRTAQTIASQILEKQREVQKSKLQLEELGKLKENIKSMDTQNNAIKQKQLKQTEKLIDEGTSLLNYSIQDLRQLMQELQNLPDHQKLPQTITSSSQPQPQHVQQKLPHTTTSSSQPQPQHVQQSRALQVPVRQRVPQSQRSAKGTRPVEVRLASAGAPVIQLGLRQIRPTAIHPSLPQMIAVRAPAVQLRARMVGSPQRAIILPAVSSIRPTAGQNQSFIIRNSGPLQPLRAPQRDQILGHVLSIPEQPGSNALAPASQDNAITSLSPQSNALMSLSSQSNALLSMSPQTNAITSLSPQTNAITSLSPQTNAITSLSPQSNVLLSLSPQMSSSTSLSQQTSATPSLSPQTSAIPSLSPQNAVIPSLSQALCSASAHNGSTPNYVPEFPKFSRIHSSQLTSASLASDNIEIETEDRNKTLGVLKKLCKMRRQKRLSLPQNVHIIEKRSTDTSTSTGTVCSTSPSSTSLPILQTAAAGSINHGDPSPSTTHSVPPMTVQPIEIKPIEDYDEINSVEVKKEKKSWGAPRNAPPITIDLTLEDGETRTVDLLNDNHEMDDLETCKLEPDQCPEEDVQNEQQTAEDGAQNEPKKVLHEFVQVATDGSIEVVQEMIEESELERRQAQYTGDQAAAPAYTLEDGNVPAGPAFQHEQGSRRLTSEGVQGSFESPAEQHVQAVPAHGHTVVEDSGQQNDVSEERIPKSHRTVSVEDSGMEQDADQSGPMLVIESVTSLSSSQEDSEALGKNSEHEMSFSTNFNDSEISTTRVLGGTVEISGRYFPSSDAVVESDGLRLEAILSEPELSQISQASPTKGITGQGVTEGKIGTTAETPEGSEAIPSGSVESSNPIKNTAVKTKEKISTADKKSSSKGNNKVSKKKNDMSKTSSKKSSKTKKVLPVKSARRPEPKPDKVVHGKVRRVSLEEMRQRTQKETSTYEDPPMEDFHDFDPLVDLIPEPVHYDDAVTCIAGEAISPPPNDIRPSFDDPSLQPFVVLDRNEVTWYLENKAYRNDDEEKTKVPTTPRKTAKMSRHDYSRAMLARMFQKSPYKKKLTARKSVTKSSIAIIPKLSHPSLNSSSHKSTSLSFTTTTLQGALSSLCSGGGDPTDKDNATSANGDNLVDGPSQKEVGASTKPNSNSKSAAKSKKVPVKGKIKWKGARQTKQPRTNPQTEKKGASPEAFPFRRFGRSYTKAVAALIYESTIDSNVPLDSSEPGFDLSKEIINSTTNPDKSSQQHTKGRVESTTKTGLDKNKKIANSKKDKDKSKGEHEKEPVEPYFDPQLVPDFEKEYVEQDLLNQKIPGILDESKSENKSSDPPKADPGNVKTATGKEEPVLPNAEDTPAPAEPVEISDLDKMLLEGLRSKLKGAKDPTKKKSYADALAAHLKDLGLPDTEVIEAEEEIPPVSKQEPTVSKLEPEKPRTSAAEIKQEEGAAHVETKAKSPPRPEIHVALDDYDYGDEETVESKAPSENNDKAEPEENTNGAEEVEEEEETIAPLTSVAGLDSLQDERWKILEQLQGLEDASKNDQDEESNSEVTEDPIPSTSKKHKKKRRSTDSQKEKTKDIKNPDTCKKKREAKLRHSNENAENGDEDSIEENDADQEQMGRPKRTRRISYAEVSEDSPAEQAERLSKENTGSVIPKGTIGCIAVRKKKVKRKKKSPELDGFIVPDDDETSDTEKHHSKGRSRNRKHKRHRNDHASDSEHDAQLNEDKPKRRKSALYTDSEVIRKRICVQTDQGTKAQNLYDGYKSSGESAESNTTNPQEWMNKLKQLNRQPSEGAEDNELLNRIRESATASSDPTESESDSPAKTKAKAEENQSDVNSSIDNKQEPNKPEEEAAKPKVARQKLNWDAYLARKRAASTEVSTVNVPETQAAEHNPEPQDIDMRIQSDLVSSINKHVLIKILEDVKRAEIQSNEKVEGEKSMRPVNFMPGDPRIASSLVHAAPQAPAPVTPTPEPPTDWEYLRRNLGKAREHRKFLAEKKLQDTARLRSSPNDTKLINEIRDLDRSIEGTDLDLEIIKKDINVYLDGHAAMANQPVPEHLLFPEEVKEGVTDCGVPLMLVSNMVKSSHDKLETLKTDYLAVTEEMRRTPVLDTCKLRKLKGNLAFVREQRHKMLELACLTRTAPELIRDINAKIYRYKSIYGRFEQDYKHQASARNNDRLKHIRHRIAALEKHLHVLKKLEGGGATPQVVSSKYLASTDGRKPSPSHTVTSMSSPRAKTPDKDNIPPWIQRRRQSSFSQHSEDGQSDSDIKNKPDVRDGGIYVKPRAGPSGSAPDGKETTALKTNDEKSNQESKPSLGNNALQEVPSLTNEKEGTEFGIDIAGEQKDKIQGETKDSEMVNVRQSEESDKKAAPAEAGLKNERPCEETCSAATKTKNETSLEITPSVDKSSKKKSESHNILSQHDETNQESAKSGKEPDNEIPMITDQKKAEVAKSISEKQKSAEQTDSVASSYVKDKRDGTKFHPSRKITEVGDKAAVKSDNATAKSSKHSHKENESRGSTKGSPARKGCDAHSSKRPDIKPKVEKSGADKKTSNSEKSSRTITKTELKQLQKGEIKSIIRGNTIFYSKNGKVCKRPIDPKKKKESGRAPNESNSLKKSPTKPKRPLSKENSSGASTVTKKPYRIPKKRSPQKMKGVAADKNAPPVATVIEGPSPTKTELPPWLSKKTKALSSWSCAPEETQPQTQPSVGSIIATELIEEVKKDLAETPAKREPPTIQSSLSPNEKTPPWQTSEAKEWRKKLLKEGKERDEKTGKLGEKDDLKVSVMSTLSDVAGTSEDVRRVELPSPADSHTAGPSKDTKKTEVSKETPSSPPRKEDVAEDGGENPWKNFLKDQSKLSSADDGSPNHPWDEFIKERSRIYAEEKVRHRSYTSERSPVNWVDDRSQSRAHSSKTSAVSRAPWQKGPRASASHHHGRDPRSRSPTDGHSHHRDTRRRSRSPSHRFRTDSSRNRRSRSRSPNPGRKKSNGPWSRNSRSKPYLGRNSPLLDGQGGRSRSGSPALKKSSRESEERSASRKARSPDRGSNSSSEYKRNSRESSRSRGEPSHGRTDMDWQGEWASDRSLDYHDRKGHSDRRGKSYGMSAPMSEKQKYFHGQISNLKHGSKVQEKLQMQYARKEQDRSSSY